MPSERAARRRLGGTASTPLRTTSVQKAAAYTPSTMQPTVKALMSMPAMLLQRIEQDELDQQRHAAEHVEHPGQRQGGARQGGAQQAEQHAGQGADKHGAGGAA